MTDLKETLYGIARAIVDNPDEVSVIDNGGEKDIVAKCGRRALQNGGVHLRSLCRYLAHCFVLVGALEQGLLRKTEKQHNHQCKPRKDCPQ